MFLATSSRRGLSAALPSFWVCVQRSWWQPAQSTFFSLSAGSLLCALAFSALSVMSVWQATQVILACTPWPNLSPTTLRRARGLSSGPGTSSLPFLPSWQLRQVALSSVGGDAGVVGVAAGAGKDSKTLAMQSRPAHREDRFMCMGMLQVRVVILSRGHDLRVVQPSGQLSKC